MRGGRRNGAAAADSVVLVLGDTPAAARGASRVFELEKKP